MKKAKIVLRGSAAKGSAVPMTMDDYLVGVPEPARSTLNKVRATIRSVVPPEATEDEVQHEETESDTKIEK